MNNLKLFAIIYIYRHDTTLSTRFIVFRRVFGKKPAIYFLFPIFPLNYTFFNGVLVRPLLPYYQDKDSSIPIFLFFASFLVAIDNSFSRRSSRAPTYYIHFQRTAFLAVFALFRSISKYTGFCPSDILHYSFPLITTFQVEEIYMLNNHYNKYPHKKQAQFAKDINALVTVALNLLTAIIRRRGRKSRGGARKAAAMPPLTAVPCWR